MWVCAGCVLKATAGILRMIKWVCVGAPTAAHGLTQSWVNKWWSTGPCEILGCYLGSGLSYFVIIFYCLVKIIWISHAVKTSTLYTAETSPSIGLISLSAAFSGSIQKNNFTSSCFAFFPFQEDHKGKSGRECKQHHRESDGHQQDDVPAGAAEWGDCADLRYSWSLGWSGGVMEAPLVSSVSLGRGADQENVLPWWLRDWPAGLL